MKNLPGSQIDVQSGNGEKKEFSEKFGVRREPFRTGEDKTWSRGPYTIMDRVHGHFVNFYRKVLHRVHEHSFLNSKS